MTNEETLELLKPIMLDGTEKVGYKVFSSLYGEGTIIEVTKQPIYPLVAKFINDTITYTKYGYEITLATFPTLFKTNPFEYLANLNNNQERVIEVHTNNGWVKRVLVTIKSGYAICWSTSDNIEDARKEIITTPWNK